MGIVWLVFSTIILSLYILSILLLP